MLGTLRRDVRAVRERDPAARSTLEAILCYPGLHAVWGYRIGHWLWGHKLLLLARLVSTITHRCTGVDIHPAATIGSGLFIDHATGVVIGETAEVGDDVTIYHGVTLGGTSLERGKRHPTIGDRVTIGAGAKVLGPFTVGHDSRIGANAVVVKPAPPDSVVVGVPGQVIVRSYPRPQPSQPDLDQVLLPDLIGVSIRSLLTRVEELEVALNCRLTPAHVHPSETGMWPGEDFSI
ncbi:MAG: serine O-acetyltransferase [Dactylosporangium sp.]|nr:serine O-acetyltransferase [Dactylosporangium sp.]